MEYGDATATPLDSVGLHGCTTTRKKKWSNHHEEESTTKIAAREGEERRQSKVTDCYASQECKKEAAKWNWFFGFEARQVILNSLKLVINFQSFLARI